MAFQIKPNRKETENKTIRFPIPLIDNIEKAIQGQDVTFSRFVIQACEYALNNLEDSKSKAVSNCYLFYTILHFSTIK